jgi:dolichol-phosphate mannosyltransferase
MRISTPVSVVVPCFNEQAVLPALYERLTAACARLHTDYEIVLVNDGSRDGTWQVMCELASFDPRLVCVNLSRNYGHQPALSAGLSECSGEAVLVIDADLQDPPELLPEMLAVMRREGADVVYGRRTSRAGEPWLKRVASHAYYRGLVWLADVPIPPDAGDFRLLSRRVVDGLLAMPERQRYVRGLVSWLGYKQVPFDYHRQPRAAGKSNYNFRRLAALACAGVTGFSTRPLTLALRVGGLCLLAALITLVAALYAWANGPLPVTGLLAALMLFLSGGQFLALGVIGTYLGQMHAEVRGRPLYVVDRIVRNSASAVVRPGNRLPTAA